MFGPASSVMQGLELPSFVVRLCYIEIRKHICTLFSSSVQCTTELVALHVHEEVGEVPRIPEPTLRPIIYS